MIRRIVGRVIYEIGWVVQRHPINEPCTRWYDWIGFRIQEIGINVNVNVKGIGGNFI